MKYLTSLLFFLFVHFSMAHNPFWSQLDKRLIRSLVKINKESTGEFEKYFKSSKEPKNMINLGFGWKVWAPSKSGGYISISSEFFYFNDSLVAFKINAELPDEKLLRKKYLKWYNGYFHLDQGSTLTPFFHNAKALFKPLPNIEDSLQFIELKQPLSSLMKPTPNLSYYWSGGYTGSISSNRKLFLENADSLSFAELKFMTYSINPITRFMAIEEIIRKNYIETACTRRDLEWYKRCFTEVPLIKTLNGCIGSTENSESLVYLFSRMNYR